MAKFDVARFDDIFQGAADLAAGGDKIGVAKNQISKAVTETQRVLEISEDDARKYVAGYTLLNGVTNGIVPQKTWDNLPAEIRAVLKYGPAELDVNKKITNLKTYGTPVAIAGGLAGALALGVAPIVAIPAALGALGWYLNGLANDWNDVNHWGPQFQQQTALDLVKVAQKAQNVGLSAGNVFTAADIKEVFEAYQRLGAVGVVDPIAATSSNYTQSAVERAINNAAAYLISSGIVAKKKDVLSIINGWIIKAGQTGTVVPNISVPSGSSTGSSSQSVKVFTGIVSQGKLGEGLAFQARQDDLIETVAELEQAANNNLAAYLIALPQRIVYEIKVVSSITTKDGFKQTGTSQTIQVGTYKDGTPKYKTIVNRFATLTLYLLSEKGIRSKITTIVLGPTNASKFNPTQQALRQLEGSIQSNIVTSDLKDVQEIKTAEQIVVSQPTTQTPVQQNKAGADAQTLSEWYTANGQKLPTVEERAPIYESYGLGKAALYTGTAEQNVKLLAALKGMSTSSAAIVQTPATLSIAEAKAAGVKLTYYNNGRNGTIKETFGSKEQTENQRMQDVVARLTSDPTKRDIQANWVPAFYNGDISLEELSALIGSSPTYDPTIGPKIKVA